MTMMTTTKERPILFSTEMVRALLAGKKIQTRRQVKLNAELIGRGCTSLDGAWVDPGFGDGEYLKVPGPDQTSHRLYSPYGYKGDRLWVRETWTPFDTDHVIDGKRWAYRADQKAGDSDSERCRKELGYKWRPSIFMPRKACRIELELTYVRVEPVMTITERDAIAEGFMAYWLEACKREDAGVPNAVGWYAALWDKINGKGSWLTNPWVWVLEFKRVS